MKTWQFVVPATAVIVVLATLATPDEPEGDASVVQGIEETKQVDGGLRATVRMRAPGREASDVDSIGYAISDALEDMRASGERYNEVVFAVEAPIQSGDYSQAFSVFYDGTGPVGLDLASARSRDVFDAGEPAIVTPLGQAMLAAYCMAAEALDRPFCREALK